LPRKIGFNPTLASEALGSTPFREYAAKANASR